MCAQTHHKKIKYRYDYTGVSILNKLNCQQILQPSHLQPQTQYLRTAQPKKKIARKPIFKCLPPPSYARLKTILLHDYHRIQELVPHPLFIALGHATLKKEPHLEPSPEQFFAIIMILPTNPTHKVNTRQQENYPAATGTTQASKPAKTQDVPQVHISILTPLSRVQVQTLHTQ